ncbi:MAG: hypothetical protein AABY14_01105 [Nanoarchaeota archaeon]
MKLNKKAIELSVNFIVVLIISIVVFSMGIFFVKKIFEGSEKTQQSYFERYDREVQDLLCNSKDIICIPKDTIDYSKKQSPFYGIVISNILGEEYNFNLVVNFSKAYNPDNSVLCDTNSEGSCGDPSQWLTTGYDTNPIIIKNNEQAKKAIALDVKGAKTGTYVFDVRVCVNQVVVDGKITFTDIVCSTDGSLTRYSSLQKIYLTTP